jgi:hypothetical protein
MSKENKTQDEIAQTKAVIEEKLREQNIKKDCKTGKFIIKG